jgi:ABC-type lipoprotein export system ATPase subunit
VHRPRLFIADEPTGELDAANATEIYALVRELSRDVGATTIVVSHDPESAQVADRVVQIRDGRVSGESRGSGRVAAVVNRGGWIRLPEDLVGDAARAEVERVPDGILVRIAERAGGPETQLPAEPAPGPVVAETVELTKVHGRGAHAVEVFRALTLGFSAGRLCAVTGPSGSGKSTLLHLLAGLDIPTAGEVVVAGTRLSQLDATGRAELRRDRIGLVTQGTDLVPFLTAQESVELALALRGVGRADATERATASLSAVGLGELAAQRVARLSMGERQRVALARALSTRPELLLADEPTARLDEANARAIGVLFAELAQQTGTAIVCATHDPVLIEHASAEVVLGTVAA